MATRRFGSRVAWISIAFVIALIALRGGVVWHVITNVAPCPACMGATAMQQDSVLLGIFLMSVAGAFFFRAYILQLPFLLFGALLIVVMAIDSMVLLTLTQRLYLFDVLKFGKELGAITQFARIFLESGTGKIVGVLSIFGLVLLACLFAPRPRRSKAALILLLMGATSIAFGSWRPSTMSYIHYEVLQNVLAANLELGVDRAYTAAFAENVKRDLKPETPICTDRAGDIARPNILFVLVESLSMHHSRLFGGARDLTPNLDAIAQRYTYVPNFYANGFTTDGGMIALITGRAPVPAVGRYESVEAFKGFENPAGALPDELHKNGYNVNFFTTGDLAFLDKTAWLRELHFDHFEGAENPFYDGMKRWHFNAAEDKQLYRRFLQWMDQRTDTSPWFSMLLTVSTHPPFVNPRTDQPDEPGVFKYADEQIGMLFDELNERHFFDNGILLISGDHRSMTPLFAQEQAKFGDSAMARVPMVIATNLRLKHGAVTDAFQQADLLPSLQDLTNAHACRTEDEGWLLREDPLPPKYIVHARGDKRDRLDIYFKGTDGTEREGNIILDGDASRWRGDKPDDWQQIMLRVAADRIDRGGDKENALDFIIDQYFPHPTDPTSPHQGE
ncbi:MAG TPA: LTA synthase family protein [Rudaea sp.]|nr:LTA synthase family protein [Rudaea sp.]